MNTLAQNPPTDMAGSSEAVKQLYDSRMYDRLIDELYGGSGFLNFGYWEPNTRGARAASENLMDKLLAFIPQKRGDILDVACGAGATTRYLLRYYEPGQVTGINISGKQLASCRQKAPECTFLLMDAVNLGFQDLRFDAIICVEAAFHFNTRRQFIQEACRVLKPDGRLVLSDALISNVNQRERPHFPQDNFTDNLDEYRTIYTAAGFREVEIFDSTTECWKGCFWNSVRFAHGKFLEGEISEAQLYAFLERIYRLTVDLKYYVLVAATK